MLDNIVSITVPSTQGLRGKITKKQHKARASEVLAIMAQMFGGATATEGLGSYMAEDGTLILEAVIIVESHTTYTDLEKRRLEVVEVAKTYRKLWAQESIAYTFNNSMLFA